MAKQRAAKQKRTEDSIVFRSTELLGRMIGELQRQLDGVSKRLPSNGNNGDARRAVRRSQKKDRARSNAAKRSTVATRPK